MPFPRKRNALLFTEQEKLKLESIRKSRTEEKRRTLRAAILLDSRSGRSDEAIARHHHVSRGTVLLCIQKCLEFGLEAALGELPRPGKPRQLTDDAIAWVQNLACQKPKELGYSYELWTYRLLTAHVHRHCLAAGHPALQKLSRSKLHKILRQGELRPHKIRYYVERCRRSSENVVFWTGSRGSNIIRAVGASHPSDRHWSRGLGMYSVPIVIDGIIWPWRMPPRKSKLLFACVFVPTRR